ncbi:acetyl-CoA carboxylase biotin carboxylase subunit [Natronoflexus pectinivorans]|uniref:biotin carboxylase n=1 Tax=Natronoflexus pectinivorans TaxID=682526 RepID=A0A4R2GE72_9BACT|nr:biotin carboxylase N-terminal domain-containing protein [Natronoflexus pectinivorans]TCO06042.1 acetyl-CoA carboxylase biotin carboxylase subunit [Natronoflexus pectinivorans]
MIKSLLIANRGEIAIRIARTARRMGVIVYAVRTKKEPDALYLTAADVVLDFPDTELSVSEFLDINALVKLAVDNGVEAIHPGYGFLSENADFASACKKSGVIFIGPPAEVIDAMGDKIKARAYAMNSGVNVPGGSKSPIEKVDDAKVLAEKIGYPVIIKATAGGGGRGMRIVSTPEDMQLMFSQATSEALNAFGNSSVYIEKYIENPKHIEVQIVADNHGSVIHLGERECSVQRKHQKLLEEAPSPALDGRLRKKMTSAAVALAKSIKYKSLGTVEFLLDKNGEYYFMEMNTRLQVEHPVTEMITGLDLVEFQILIASGAKLPVKQSEVEFKGWSIECRINAEDVQSGFVPSMGIIRGIRLPQGNNIRIDTGVRPGSEITPFFDSMVAKLIVHGNSRAEVIEKTMKALRQFHVKGVKTTIPFCKAVLSNPLFRSGYFDTSFVETAMDSPVHREPQEEFLAALLSVYAQTHNTTPITSDEVQIDPWVLKKRIRNL